jgi:hypothetical protein
VGEIARDALLVETRRAIESMRPDLAPRLVEELEHWIPPDGSLPFGRATLPIGFVLGEAIGAALHAYPERGSYAADQILARITPWMAIAETVTWCAGRTIAELRTGTFAPPNAVATRPGVDWFLWGNDASRSEQLARIEQTRRSALPADHVLQPSIPPGRFLVYWPDEQSSDGSSQLASDGFFDIFDAPPWDTWIHYEPVHHFLVSWVPLSLVQHAAIGMTRNTVACHAWLDDLARPEHARHSLRIAFAPWLRALAARAFP